MKKKFLYITLICMMLLDCSYVFAEQTQAINSEFFRSFTPEEMLCDINQALAPYRTDETNEAIYNASQNIHNSAPNAIEANRLSVPASDIYAEYTLTEKLSAITQALGLNDEAVIATTPLLKANEAGTYILNLTGFNERLYGMTIHGYKLMKDYGVPAGHNDISTFLNSSGQIVNAIPGNDDSNVIVPGYVAALVYFEAGAEYVIAVTAEVPPASGSDDITPPVNDNRSNGNDNPGYPKYTDMGHATYIEGMVDVRFDLQLGGEVLGHPHIWHIISGDLPIGLSMTEEGLISGVPTRAGEYFFVLEEISPDSGSVLAVIPYVMNIRTASEGQTITITSTPFIRFYTYADNSFTFTANQPATWTAKDLPEDFTLNRETGELTGVTYTAGEYSFDVTATFDASRVHYASDEDAAVSDTKRVTMIVDESPRSAPEAYDAPRDDSGTNGGDNSRSIQPKPSYIENLNEIAGTIISLLQQINDKLAQLLEGTSGTVQELPANSYGNNRTASDLSPSDRAQVPSSQDIAAVLPEITVDAPGVYVFGAELPGLNAGTAIFLYVNASGSSGTKAFMAASDSEGAYCMTDDNGQEIHEVPANGHVNIAAYMEDGVTYSAFITTETQNSSSGSSGGGGCSSGISSLAIILLSVFMIHDKMQEVDIFTR